MRLRLTWHAGLLFAGLLLGNPSGLTAQAVSRPFPAWETALPDTRPDTSLHRLFPSASPDREGSAGNHARTGLLIGAAVGLAASTLFLIQFCDDPDTECGADEVGRAVAVFTVPAALAGMSIGYLIPKRE
jgi:hypothetical protein